MFSTINKLLIKFIPLLPISFIRMFSNRYIAGTSVETALKVIKRINKSNMSATIDILGEHTISKSEADKITNDYINLYKEIKLHNLNCNISLKPSHIGSDINLEYFKNNLNKIHREAINNRNFLRLDMEDSELTDLTIDTFKKQYIVEQNIGIVIQAYLRRSMQDIENLSSKMNIRLCKGIYNESSDIAIKDPDKINKNYISLLENALDNNLFVGIATHDKELINNALNLIENKNINKKNVEFQILYGVPMGNIIKQLLDKEFKIRVYIPFSKNSF